MGLLLINVMYTLLTEKHLSWHTSFVKILLLTGLMLKCYVYLRMVLLLGLTVKECFIIYLS